MSRFIVAFSLLLVCSFAVADPRYVIDVDGDKFFLDIGKKGGVSVGDRFAVFQRIEKEHPVTKEKIQDQIELGVLRVIEASQNLSIAKLDGEAKSTIPIGALIELLPKEEPKPTPKEEPLPAPKPPAAIPSQKIAKHSPVAVVDELETLDVEVVFVEPVSEVNIRYRRTGEGKSIEANMTMTALGRYSAEIDPNWVEPPSVEYQIFYRDPSGMTRTLPEEGNFKTVVTPRPFSRTQDLKALYGRPSGLTVSGTTTNFGGGQGNYSGATIDYHHRIFTKLYGIRMGAGFLHGEPANGDTSTYTYALAEIELRLYRHLSLLPRVTLGVQEEGFEVGGHFFVRIGREVGYNLLVGTSAINNLGGEFLVINLNAPAGKALTLGGEVKVSDLFSEGPDGPLEPGLIMSFLPQLRLTEGFGVLGSLGVATRSSSSLGFTGRLALSYYF